MQVDTTDNINIYISLMLKVGIFLIPSCVRNTIDVRMQNYINKTNYTNLEK